LRGKFGLYYRRVFTDTAEIMPSATSRFRSNLVIVLVAAGAILLLGNLSPLGIGSLLSTLLRWWPLALIVFGLLTLLGGTSARFNRALFLTMMGVLLQIVMLGWLPADMLQWWPVFALVFGLWLLVVQPKNAVRVTRITSASFRYRAFLEGSKLYIVTPSFVEATVNTRLAMLECDFASATASKLPLSLSLHVFCGSVCLELPETWRISSDINMTLGAFKDERDVGNPPLLPGTPELQLNGSVLMGTVIIRDAHIPEKVEEDTT
jgi:hypothetical protein